MSIPKRPLRSPRKAVPKNAFERSVMRKKAGSYARPLPKRKIPKLDYGPMSPPPKKR